MRPRRVPTHVLALWLALGLLIGSGGSRALAQTPLPRPTAYVTDNAGLMSPAARASLSGRLEAYGRATGRQVLVYIDRSLGEASLEDLAVRSYEAWGVGQRGKDEGAVLFVFTQDRKARIEVGYGAEDRLTDAVSSRILGDILAPALRAQNPDLGITRAAEAMVRTIEGAPLGGEGGESQTRGARPRGGVTTGELVIFGIVGLLLLGLFATHPALAMHLLFMLMSGGRGGGFGGGGGGGGFSGGGGRSGGGGASGSW